MAGHPVIDPAADITAKGPLTFYLKALGVWRGGGGDGQDRGQVFGQIPALADSAMGLPVALTPGGRKLPSPMSMMAAVSVMLQWPLQPRTHLDRAQWLGPRTCRRI